MPYWSNRIPPLLHCPIIWWFGALFWASCFKSTSSLDVLYFFLGEKHYFVSPMERISSSQRMKITDIRYERKWKCLGHSIVGVCAACRYWSTYAFVKTKKQVNLGVCHSVIQKAFSFNYRDLDNTAASASEISIHDKNKWHVLFVFKSSLYLKALSWRVISEREGTST